MILQKMIMTIVLGGLFLLTGLNTIKAESDLAFSDDDQGRIFYLSSRVGNLPAGSFLVLEKKNNDRSCICNVLGSTRKHTVALSAMRPLPFYENSTPLIITQYALQDYAAGHVNSPALQLARIFGDNTNRVNRIAQFEFAFNKLKSAIKTAQRQRGLEDMDLDEYEDALIEVLEKNEIFDVIKQAASYQDWMLTIALHNAYLQGISRNSGILLPTTRTRNAGEKFLQSQSMELLNLFAMHLTKNNVRSQEFRRRFPKARGLWLSGPPTTYNQMRQFFQRSMQSFIRLDELSQIATPQDWGSAMLDVLLMIENVPGTDELKREFDEAMKRWANSRQVN